MKLINKIGPRLAVAAYLFPVAFVVHAICFWGRGIIDKEAMIFVLNYLEKRPFLATIFDPGVNDSGLYQARELSYLFDFIDARVFAALLDRNILFFVPPSGVVGLVAVSAIYVLGARKVLGLEHVTISLSLSLFLSCIVVQASTAVFYRSSKIALSVALIGFLFWLASLVRDTRPATILKLALLSFLGVLMSLCDRQGFFYLVTATMIVTILCLVRMARSSLVWPSPFRLMLALLAAIIAGTMYNHVVAPIIIHSLNGYSPSFDYQHLTRAQLLDPTLPVKAWQMFRAQVSFFFGNIPFTAVCVIIAVGSWMIVRKSAVGIRSSGNFKHLLTNDLLIATLASALALNFLLLTMIARHPPVYSIPDHSFWYYTLSMHVIILFGVATCSSLLNSQDQRRWKSAIWVLLLILIAFNIAHYPRQRQIMINSDQWFKKQYEHSQVFVDQFASTGATAAPNPDGVKLPEDEVNFLEEVRAEYAALKEQPSAIPTESR